MSADTVTNVRFLPSTPAAATIHPANLDNGALLSALDQRWEDLDLYPPGDHEDQREVRQLLLVVRYETLGASTAHAWTLIDRLLSRPAALARAGWLWGYNAGRSERDDQVDRLIAIAQETQADHQQATRALTDLERELGDMTALAAYWEARATAAEARLTLRPGGWWLAALGLTGLLLDWWGRRRPTNETTAAIVVLALVMIAFL